MIPGNDQNASPTNQKTVGNKLDRTSLLLAVPWVLAELYFNRGPQRLYTGTCIILQKTVNGFLRLLIVFLKSKTHQLNLKDVIELNRNLRLSLISVYCKLHDHDTKNKAIIC